MAEKEKIAEVVSFPSGKRLGDAKESEKKWGRAVMGLGYSIVPSLIFQAQRRLGLTSVQLVLLLHLADFWWRESVLPFPSKATLAERLNLSSRQIQRHLADLEKAGLIERKERYASHKGQKSNEYDLTGLARRLREIEPDFTKVKRENREQTAKVRKQGGLQAGSKVGREGKGENE